jgi:hypothetical protein
MLFDVMQLIQEMDCDEGRAKGQWIDIDIDLPCRHFPVLTIQEKELHGDSRDGRAKQLGNMDRGIQCLSGAR